MLTLDYSLLIPWWIKFELSSISDYVKKYATEEALKDTKTNVDSSDSESSMSDFSEDEAQHMEL